MDWARFPACSDRLSILPDEVLEMILRHLEKSEDLANASRASPSSERLLCPTKTTWLFHEILPLLAPYLTKQDLLQCRQVCSKWRRSVNTHLETLSDVHHQRKFSFSPRSSTAITGFCYAMKSHPGNPFPARTVDFTKVADRRYTTGYWIHVFQFLNQFGEHIWTCNFDFGNTRLDLFVIILRQCLSQLKNVKRLRISWRFDGEVVSEEKMMPDLEKPRFPPLNHLEHMELTGVFSRLFYQKVLIPLYSKQLKTLKADGVLPQK